MDTARARLNLLDHSSAKLLPCPLPLVHHPSSVLPFEYRVRIFRVKGVGRGRRIIIGAVADTFSGYRSPLVCDAADTCQTILIWLRCANWSILKSQARCCSRLDAICNGNLCS